MTKRCVICKVHVALAEFNRRASSRDGLQPHCRECNRAASKAYYRRNKVKHLVDVRRNNVRYLRAVQEMKLEYLLAHPCIDCGERNPIVLEFDHVKGEKLGDIARLITSGVHTERVRKEIAKCEVRCVNCHRRKTHHERPTWRSQQARQS